MGRPDMDGPCRFRRGVEDAVKQFLWYATQTAIVAVVLYGYHESGGRDYGIALILGIGWALCATIVFYLIADGIRRLAVLILTSRRENGNAVSIGNKRPLIPLNLLSPVDGSEGKSGTDGRPWLRDS